MIWENTLSGMVDSTASRFDESTQYKKSDYVWYAATGVKPKLYKAKADIPAGAWDASKWEEIVTPTMFSQGGWHIGNSLETLDGVKWHDYPEHI